jgi:hypothetical protein
MIANDLALGNTAQQGAAVLLACYWTTPSSAHTSPAHSRRISQGRTRFGAHRRGTISPTEEAYVSMTDQVLASLLERCSEEIAQAEAIEAGESEGCIIDLSDNAALAIESIRTTAWPRAATASAGPAGL